MDFTRVRQNLEKKGYAVSVFPDRAAAADYLDAAIDGSTVGIGGSVTVRDLGLYDRLRAHNTVYWHWQAAPGEEPAAIYRGAQEAEVYLSSVNGLAETGEIVNIDGMGNRVAAIQYGHRKVYFIVGANKLAPNREGALFRARNTAAPMNARRLNRKTPCVREGHCCDCDSPERICAVLSMLWKKPGGCEYEVVLIDEELGY